MNLDPHRRDAERAAIFDAPADHKRDFSCAHGGKPAPPIYLDHAEIPSLRYL
jgi:hypothetical protein